MVHTAGVSPKLSAAEARAFSAKDVLISMPGEANRAAQGSNRIFLQLPKWFDKMGVVWAKIMQCDVECNWI